MKTLNSPQRQAVQHLGSPLLVLAGAGSGKTRVITRKISWLIRERAVDPAAITAVTFTNKAAREMKERVRAELRGEKTRGLTVSTFHSLGLNILRRETESAGLRKGFSILDPRDVLTIVADFMRAEAGAKEELIQGICHRISAWKNAGLSPEQVVVEDLLEEIGYRQWLFDSGDEPTAERRWENITELLGWLGALARDAESDAGLSELVGQLMLRDILDREQDEEDDDQASLMTLHAAKGLEFDYVFIAGVEEEILPHRNSISAETVEEERRLFYVGITRAKRRLTLSHASRRRRFGEQLECEPSRFLPELPADDLEWEAPQGNQTPDKNLGRAHLANIRAMLGGK